MDKMNLKFVSSVFILSIFFLLIILIQSFTSIQSDVSSDIASNSQNSRHLLEAVKHVDSLKIKDSKLTEVRSFVLIVLHFLTYIYIS